MARVADVARTFLRNLEFPSDAAAEQAKGSIRQAEGELRQLLDLTPMHITELGPDGSLLYINRAALEYHGLTLDQWRNADLYSLVHPQDAERLTRELPRKFESGSPYELEARLKRRDGQHRWFLVRINPMLDEEGRLKRWYSAATDIHDRKQAEDERARFAQRLRQAEKMEALGRLAGGIAHDFNNVLSGIVAYGEMVLEQAPASSGLQHHAQNVLDAANRGRALVEQILLYSGSRHGKRSPVHFGTVVAETLELIRGSLPANIRLEMSIPGLPLVVIGDATQLHQILMNLCTNAIQAMSGGGALRVALEAADLSAERALSHGTLGSGRYVRLTVEDRGSGIDEATLLRIFEPFFTTKEVGRGTGLGLSIVYAIVADSGGAIDVKSAVEQGSTFAVYLPLAEIVTTANDASREDMMR
jgi:PAS domain S-box-containing protein